MKPNKPGKRIDRLLTNLRSGELLRCEHTPEGGDGGVRYWLDPSLRSVGPITVEKAKTLGLLLPLGDGLFPGADQSWRAVP